MAASMNISEKLSKSERKARKKHLRSQHTLLRHENIKTTEFVTEHLVVANGGLANNIQREELVRIFSRHGCVLDIVMQPNKPYSFVCYSTKAEAESAVTNLHGRKMNSPQELATPDVIFYLSYVETVPGNEVPSSTVLPNGLILLTDVVSEQEEQHLLECVGWGERNQEQAQGTKESTLKHRRVKHFGYEFIYGINNVDLNCPLDQPIPEECQPVLHQLVKSGVIQEYPDQLTVNQYQPGQGIPPHIDTHSAFEDSIVSLSLGSQIVMDFRHDDGRHIPVLLPPRSALIMTGESRYAWTHGITPRKSDIIPVNAPSPALGGREVSSKEAVSDEVTASKEVMEGEAQRNNCDTESDGANISESHVESSNQRLTLAFRGVRTSFTFRKVLKGPCQCKFPKQCDSQQDSSVSDRPGNAIPKTDEEAAKLEKLHVHQVYEDIADHFSDTRHKAWPKVAEFLDHQKTGAIVADIGCGNGKYLGINRNTYSLGCDRSYNLCAICAGRGFPVYVADVLAVPLRDESCDVAISIAVIHHLSTLERRQRAVREMVRVLRPGGRGLISVWAMEQETGGKASNYVQKSREKRKHRQEHDNDENNVNSRHNQTDDTHSSTLQNDSECTDEVGDSVVGESSAAEPITRCNSAGSGSSETLSVHINRTNFEQQDLLVPWHRKNRANRPRNIPRDTPDDVTPSPADNREESVYHRFYHVFERNELENLVDSVSNTQIIDRYLDKGNWCVIFEKHSPK